MRLGFRQCHLEQTQGRAPVHHTAWLPETFAVLGGSVRLRDVAGDWSDPWKVTFVSQSCLPEDVVRKTERAHRRQRKASDV